MSGQTLDLHGSAPDSAPMALLIIDMINNLDFRHGPELLQFALPAAHAIGRLRQRAHEAGIPVIFVNDNFGKWQSDFRRLVDYCGSADSTGRPLVEVLAPDPEDYFVLKPKHSGFFSTTLELLLKHLQTRKLILTGIAADICVLFTANDAYMRDYEVIVPPDCVASETEDRKAQALELVHRVLKGDLTPSDRIVLQHAPAEQAQAGW